MVLSRRRRFGSLVAVLVAGVAGCTNVEPALTRHAKASHVASELRIQFKKAADASNLAVLADTDEASVAFAAEAEAAKKAVHENLDLLGPLVEGFDEEKSTLAELVKRLAAYETLDKVVLELAVENTNLKAQRLSFGPARDSANAFRAALDAAAKASSAEKSCEVAASCASAVIAVREIQVIQPVHIAERDDEAMNRMEKEMNALEDVARGALEKLAASADSGVKAELANATKALDKFKVTHTEIVTLSRKNSNVRSSMLALGEKRALASACESSLEALTTALSKRASSATR